MNNFILFWQNIPQHLNPIFLDLGFFQIRYYGLMYLTAIIVAYILIRYRLKHENFSYSFQLVESFVTWLVIGVVLGARLGYVLFYHFSYYVTYPLEIILPFQWENGLHFTGIAGLSYHGGLIGGVLATFIFCWRKKIKFWPLVDFIVPAIPLGYAFGRLGNFLNGELYGRVTNAAWGMYFPTAPTMDLRHPSQLYEMFFEGIVLFVLLWTIRQKKVFNGFLFAVYLMGYAFVRFFIEYVREPDVHLGFIIETLTMGQILCLIMFGWGLIHLFLGVKHACKTAR